MAYISVVIITYNEEKNIGRCIDSVVKVADDIVVVDSFSDDLTRAICLERGVRFIEREFNNFADQKNFALTQAKYNHILSLDADECLSEQLVQSILEIKKSWTNEAFRMNRLSSYGGKWIKHGSWYPDRQIRLWNKNHGEWRSCNPHETVALKPGTEVIHLKGDLLHYSYKNSEAALNKIQLYSGLYARSNFEKKRPSLFGLMMHTGFAFFKSYILKRGFLDGFAGLAVAMSVTNHTFYKYAKLYEGNLSPTGPASGRPRKKKNQTSEKPLTPVAE
jgi:glycosyltransferase involved in cell wall biosynthesis